MSITDFSEKETYRFALFLNNEVIAERIFPADVYNQFVRYSINIRELASDMIKGFQNVLQTQDNKLTFEYDNYDLLDHYINTNHNHLSSKDSKIVRQSVGKLGEDGFYINPDEQFKFILFLNDNHVIERNFFVKRYNPNSRYSVDLMYHFEHVVKDIQNFIKKKDVSVMWEELDLKTHCRLSMDEIRSLTKIDRENLLRKIYNN